MKIVVTWSPLVESMDRAGNHVPSTPMEKYTIGKTQLSLPDRKNYN